MDIAEEQDYIVVGSGCTGAMAAQTLVEKGVKVLMLDVGEQESRYADIPQKSFLDIRKNDTNQYKYWLGEDFESISWSKTGTGAQLTPARKHMMRNTEKFLSVISDNFSGMESLSYGGLGNAWGVGCCVFSDEELKAAGLDKHKMNEAYQTVADRIGISADKDDASPYTSQGLSNLQKTQQIDENSKSIYGKYSAKKSVLNRNGFYMGKPALALLTEPKDGRQAIDYNELDFYSDKKESAYRPWITINSLKKKANFQYKANALVLSFKEENDKVTLHYLDTASNEKKSITCKKLILCPGTLGSARIVMRSLNGNNRLPFLCNPYKYFTLLQASMLGKASEEPRSGFAQLVLYFDPRRNNYDVSAASLYSYRSLMLFRTIKEVPLNFRDGRTIMQYLLPAISIMGVHHPDHSDSGKYVEMLQDNSSVTGDKLKVFYSPSADELGEMNKRDRLYSSAMRKLGCYTMKKLDPGYGSSIHYAGCLPFSEESKPFTLQSNGRLSGTKNVFIGDGSGFKYLPAKGVTLSIMAFAHIAAEQALINS
jgi:hypothetical protein